MEPQKVTYFTEISLMMFGFGDSHKPNPDTEATKYGDEKVLRGEELVFLMRKNKWKMRRFVKYLHVKDMKKSYDNAVNADVGKDIRRHSLLNFIEKLDETGELSDLSELDEVKHNRQIRADRIAMALDETKYLEFQKARCMSFNSKETSRAANFEKLRTWIDPKKELNMTNIAIEVLSYYAYQTVAEIIDYALLVRMDAKWTCDPLSNLSGTHFTATMFVGEHRFSGPNPDYSRVYNGQAPITVAEIKEVLRRVTKPQVGKLTFGEKLPETHFIFAL
ncbi:hypothetical protein FQA39_LY05524 [Lamprigera yunnana]|nr:hypothetical protein FQA39_LY05524 [Lamprigera yunnana]